MEDSNFLQLSTQGCAHPAPVDSSEPVGTQAALVKIRGSQTKKTLMLGKDLYGVSDRDKRK